MKKVIMDTSPLIFIAKAGLINFLKRCYRKVYVTRSVIREFEAPRLAGFKAPEIDVIKNSGILAKADLTAKQIQLAKKLSKSKNIGIGEAESGILFKSGGYENVIVADERARRKLKEEGIEAVDLVDFGYVVAQKRWMNIRVFAQKLYEKGHYRTQRIRNILGLHRD